MVKRIELAVGQYYFEDALFTWACEENGGVVDILFQVSGFWEDGLVTVGVGEGQAVCLRFVGYIADDVLKKE